MGMSHLKKWCSYDGSIFQLLLNYDLCNIQTIKLNGPLITLYRPAHPTDCCYHLSKNVRHVKGQKHHFALGHEASKNIFDTRKFIATEKFTV